MGTWYAPPVRRCAHLDRGHQERTESRPPRDRQEKFGGVTPISIYIDADACPVKQEIYRVAERRRRRNMDTFANSSVSATIADKDNTTRRGPAVCRAAAAAGEDCRMGRTSRRSERTHRYRHWCARGPCCSATARG